MKVVRRNGNKIEMDVDAQQLGLEYVGPLALALQNQQSTGFIQWLGEASQIAPLVPDVLDVINVPGGMRRRGEQLGVNVDDIASEEEVKAKQVQRAKMQQAAQLMQEAQAAGKAYKDGSTSPGPGSMAEQLMGATK
jgi:hypothetical protein